MPLAAQLRTEAPVAIGVRALSLETTTLFADIDGDGLEDLVVTRARCGSVHWRKQGSLGEFGPPMDVGYAEGNLPNVTLAADFDNDGDADLAVGTSAFVSVFVNEESVFHQVATLQGRLAQLTDIDFDGDVDVFCGYHWYPNKGKADFDTAIPSAEPNLSLADGHSSLVDLNNDGTLDLVQIVRDGFPSFRLTTVLSEVDGRYPDEARVTVETLTSVGGMAVEDYDQDGDPDVAVWQRGRSDLRYYENDGTGSFDSKVLEATRPIDSFATGDFDGDGLTDILGASFRNRRFSFWRNLGMNFENQELPFEAALGKGALVGTRVRGGQAKGILASEEVVEVGISGASRTLITPAVPTRFLGVRAQDVDGDGRMDLIVGSAEEDALALHVTFQEEQAWETHRLPLPEGRELEDFAFGDLDGDGDLDAAAVAFKPDGLSLLVNQGDREFTQAFAVDIGERAIEGVEIVDIDGDGDLDLVANSDSEAQVWVHDNEGDGTLGAPRVVAQLLSPIDEISIVDFNGDQLLDILVTTLDDRLTVLPATGNGEFGGAIELLDQRGSAYHFGHWNGDELADVIVRLSDGRLVWHANAGDGELESAQPIDPAGENNFFGPLYVSDLDQDGHVEVVQSRSFSLVVYRYNEGLPPSRSVLEDQRAGLGSFTSADFDGDGLLDLAEVFSGSLCSDLRIHYQTTDSPDPPATQPLTFSTLTFLLENEDFRNVQIVDLDADDRPDIAFNSRDEPPFGWIRSAGSGQFDEALRYNLIEPDLAALPPNARLVSLAEDAESGNLLVLDSESAERLLASPDFQEHRASDLDQDGDTDIVTIRDGLRLFRNQGNGEYVDEPQEVFPRYSRWRLADLDGDGLEDLLGTTGESEKFGWSRNEDGRHFGDPRVLFAEAPDLSSEPVLVGDIDADGDLDVAYVFGRLRWYANDGTGNFQLGQDLGSHDDITAMQLEDLDGDTDLDLLYATVREGLFWHPNEGSGRFVATPESLGLAFDVTDIQLGDLDLDGDVDILLAANSHSSQGYVGWIENTTKGLEPGEGTFEKWSEGYGGVSNPLDDSDHDGLIDLGEWAFGSHPEDPTSKGGLSLSVPDDETNRLALNFLRNAPANLRYALSVSDDLVRWENWLVRSGAEPWLPLEVSLSLGFTLDQVEGGGEYDELLIEAMPSDLRSPTYFRLEVQSN